MQNAIIDHTRTARSFTQFLKEKCYYQCENYSTSTEEVTQALSTIQNACCLTLPGTNHRIMLIIKHVNAGPQCPKHRIINMVIIHVLDASGTEGILEILITPSCAENQAFCVNDEDAIASLTTT